MNKTLEARWKARQFSQTTVPLQQISKFKVERFRYSFICQGISTRRQRRDLFGLRVKLPPVTTSLTT